MAVLVEGVVSGSREGGAWGWRRGIGGCDTIWGRACCYRSILCPYLSILLPDSLPWLLELRTRQPRRSLIWRRWALPANSASLQPVGRRSSAPHLLQEALPIGSPINTRPSLAEADGRISISLGSSAPHRCFSFGCIMRQIGGNPSGSLSTTHIHTPPKISSTSGCVECESVVVSPVPLNCRH